MNQFLDDSCVKYPIICGPMYPCSNPELVAAVSEAGGLGVIQPISLTYVHGYDFEEGLIYIKSLTNKPLGMNLLIEKSSLKYKERMQGWIAIALKHGVRFFITSLGKPDWVVEMVHPYGGKVYHDVTNAHWAKIAMDCHVDGLICVNASAGGHAGEMQARELYELLKNTPLPLVCAGGISDHQGYKEVMEMGYSAVQMGTAFIATDECKVPQSYKEAIITARKEDIVRSTNLTGVEVSVINTPYIKAMGLHPKGILAWMLRQPRLKKIARFVLMLRSLKKLKKMLKGTSEHEGFFQAGKSVEGITKIRSVSEVIRELVGP